MEDIILKSHNAIIEDRKKFLLSGVKQVISFDEETVMLDTALGRLAVKGIGLHILSFEQTSGDLSGEGRVNALIYTAEAADGGFFSRLFK